VTIPVHYANMERNMSNKMEIRREGSIIVCSHQDHPVNLKFDFESARALLKRLGLMRHLDENTDPEEIEHLKFTGPWGYISILSTDSLKGTIRIGNMCGFHQFPRHEYNEFARQLQEALPLSADHTPDSPSETGPEATS